METAATISVSTSGIRWGRWLLLTGRLVLGGIFVYSAWTKLQQPWMIFAMSVDSYKILPMSGVTLVARGLPWFELALGLLLWTGLWLRWSATFGTLLLGFFFSAMLRAHYNKLEIDCGCFGIGEKLDGKRIALEILIVSLALCVTLGAFLARRRATEIVQS
jgi:uncharacterized membrane protein YphA (DoxX/SURF4 family)